MVDRDLEAHHKIDSHEKVCTERYGNLWAAVERIERTLLTNNAATDNKLTAISNRMWALLVSVTGGAIIGLGVLALYLLTRPH